MSRFALLEHRWNGIHWDFLLEPETGGPLRAWAIDTPILAGKDLPARALADHRAIYLDYEGEVSAGRGTVRNIDRGEYLRLEWTNDRVRVKLAGNQLVGEVELRKAAGGEAGADTPDAWIFRLGNFN